MKTICIVTGSRADYGLLKWLMHEIQASPVLELRLIVTGMHLSSEFGLTWREIAADGFEFDRRVETLLSSDTSLGMAKSTALGVLGLAEAISDLQPDAVLLLGDRYEIFAASIASMFLGIPIIHLHGGELTEGAIDDAVRHSITKMSHLHFVSTERHRSRVIQLGEDPSRVHVVGALGLDGINRVPILSRSELARALNFDFREKNLLVTFHPETLARDTDKQLTVLLDVLGQESDIGLIFTYANADPAGRNVNSEIERFVQHHPNAVAFASLGQAKYFSCLTHVDGVVGNSSSGIIEAPSFGIGTLNIGSRQQGRERANSVIDAVADVDSIRKSLGILLSDNFRMTARSTVNPYGNGGASKRIVEVLESVEQSHLLVKKFHDLPGHDLA